VASDGFFEVRDPLVEGLTSPSGQGQEDPSREGHRHREETLLAPRAGGCFLLAFHPPDHTQLTALSSLLEHSVAARMTYKVTPLLPPFPPSLPPSLAPSPL
jgi:hypothetical protein